MPLRTAVLQLPSKSYENRPKRSAFVHFSRNGVMKREAGGQGENKNAGRNLLSVSSTRFGALRSHRGLNGTLAGPIH